MAVAAASRTAAPARAPDAARLRIFHVLLEKHRLEAIPPFGQGGRASLVAIDEAEDPRHHEARALGPLDRLQRRRARRDDVLDDGDFHTGGEVLRPLDPLRGAVLLRLLTDDERGD